MDRDQHFFATIDFDSAMTVFQKVSPLVDPCNFAPTPSRPQLGLQTAPVVYVYPPTEGSRVPANGRTSPLTYDFSK